jgi:hypothetical protein
MDSLKFPAFHRELLAQNYWNAGDELGRIKVVISEGLCHDTATGPFERFKNIVAFSFQHAPIGMDALDVPQLLRLSKSRLCPSTDYSSEVLEASSLAWPNPSMWRQIPYVAQYQGTSPRRIAETGDPDTHSHSPRCRSTPLAGSALPALITGSMGPLNSMQFPKLTGGFDPFTEPGLIQNHWRNTSSTDVSMPDYSSTESSRRVTDPMTVSNHERQYETIQSAGAYESICEALLPAAPANTPQNIADGRVSDDFAWNHISSRMPLDEANRKSSFSSMHV